ncbi:MAG: hypothetical protein JEZ07_16200 [Phycisphaerae bacterium]|nr:hypothetical protein [Phycisphaerae bacterium]
MLIGLSAYRIMIKQRRKKDWWQFERNSPQDAYEEFNNYLKSRHMQLTRLGDQDSQGNYNDQRAIMLDKIVRSEDRRMLAGIFLKGEAGMVREIRNFDERDGNAKYKTAINEGLLTPLYFRMHLEDGNRFDIILMQTMGTDGLKGYMSRDLTRYFSSEVDDNARTVNITQLLDAQVLEAFAAQGSLQDVVLINYGNSTQSKKAMEKNTVADERLGQEGDKVEMRLYRQGGFGPKAIRQMWNRIKKFGKLQDSIVGHGMGSGAVDDLKVAIRYEGRTQTFSLLNPDDSPIRMDITDQVTLGDGNVPTWESIHSAADEAWHKISSITSGGE